MTTEPVAREWVAHRERVWELVRRNRTVWGGPFVACYEYGGECVCHISSGGRRECVVCRNLLLGDVAEGAYVDADAAKAALVVKVSAEGGACGDYGQKCTLGQSMRSLPEGGTAPCSVCGRQFRKEGDEVKPVDDAGGVPE